MAKLREIVPNYQDYLDRGMSKEEVLNIARYRLKQANQQNVSQAQSVQSNANSNVAKMHDAMPGTFTQLYPNSSDIDQFFMKPKQIKTEDNSFFRGVQGITKGVLKNVRDYSKLYDDITTSKPSELTKWSQKHLNKIEKAQKRWHNRHPDEWDVAGNIGELTGDFGSDPLNVIPIGAETRAARMIGFGAIGGTSGALDAYGEGGDVKDIAKSAGYGAVGSALFGEGIHLAGKGLYEAAEYLAKLIKKHPEVADTVEAAGVDSSLRADKNDQNVKNSVSNAIDSGASAEEVEKAAENAVEITPSDVKISEILNDGKPLKNKRMVGFNSIQLLKNSLKDKPYSESEFLDKLKNEYGLSDDYALKMIEAYMKDDPNIVTKWADKKLKAHSKKYKTFKNLDDIVGDIEKKSQEQKNIVYDEGIPPGADEMKDAIPGEEVPIDASVPDEGNSVKPTLEEKIQNDPFYKLAIDNARDRSAKDIEYNRRLIQRKSGNENYNAPAIYEKNYDSDFRLTKSDVKKIEKGNITPEIAQKLEDDVIVLKNHPDWQGSIESADTLEPDIKMHDNGEIVDENGNISFSPEKFILGLGGYTVAKKMLLHPKASNAFKNVIKNALTKLEDKALSGDMKAKMITGVNPIISLGKNDNVVLNDVKDVLSSARGKHIDIPYTKENWNKLFKDKFIDTPIGKIKLGERQFEKLDPAVPDPKNPLRKKQDRRGHLSYIYQTLKEPAIAVKKDNGEKLLFFKEFETPNKLKQYSSIMIDKDGLHINISNHPVNYKQIKKEISGNDVVYIAAEDTTNLAANSSPSSAIADQSYSSANAVQTLKSQKANTSKEGASSLSDKILSKSDENVKYDAKDWTQTLAEHEGAYDEPVIKQSDMAEQLEAGSPYPTLQHSKLSEHGDGDNALSPTDKNIIPKENKNVKLSEKEVEEFKDAIKDGGIDPKAADTIVKTGIKLHGGIGEPVFNTVVKPWIDLHSKIVSGMEKTGKKIKKIPLRTVKVPVEKLSAKEFKARTGASVGDFIKHNGSLFDHFGNEYEVVNENGKNFVYKLGERQEWSDEGWGNTIRSALLDQHSDEFVKAIHLHNAAEANILKEVGKLHDRIKKEIDPKIGKELIHALDGDLDPSKLRPELRKPYEEFRKIIDEKAKMLMDLGLLDPEDKIEHYVKRLYEEHIQNKGFLDGVRESLIRREKGGRSGMLSTKYKRKDMSLEEREKLGQVFDASTVIPATVLAQDRQIERGVFFRDIARKFGSLVELNGYAQVPNDVRFGKLSGMWVPSQIHYAIVEAPEYTMGFWRYYEKLFSHWKVNKTVKNPFTHLYNAGSNIEMMVLSHTKPDAFIRQWRNGKLKEMVARAEKYGMIDDANLMFNLGEHTKIKDDPNDKRAFFKIINAMRATFNNLYLSKDSYLGKGARTVYNWEDKLFKMIAMEDNIYKMKLEKYEKLHGEKPLLQRPVKEIDEIELTPDEEYEAFKRANELFVDYQRPLPPLIDKINRRIVPFTSFAYKSTPVMLRQMMLHPLTAATINMIGGGIVGRGAALLLGLAGFEKAKEFADSYLSQDIDKLPHYKWMSNGYYDNLFGVDSWRKIGGDKEHTTYFNQGRLLQGMRADFLDALLSGGMIGQILSYGQGRDATTGRAFYHDDDPKYEKIKKTIYKMAKDFLPSTWGNLAGKYYEAFRYGQNLYGEPMTPSDVTAQAAGFRRVDNAKAKVQALKEVNKKINLVKNIDRRKAYARAKHDKYIRTHGVEGWSDRRTKKFLVDLNDKYERYKGQLIDLNKQKENINSWSDYDPTAHKAYHHRKVFSVIPRGGIIKLR